VGVDGWNMLIEIVRQLGTTESKVGINDLFTNIVEFFLGKIELSSRISIFITTFKSVGRDHRFH